MEKLELERKFLLKTATKTYVGKKWSTKLYNEALIKGSEIIQGYIKDPFASERLLLTAQEQFGFSRSLKADTIRLRRLKHPQSDWKYYLTIKQDIKPLQPEWEVRITEEVFNNFWPSTSGQRIHKKRFVMPFPHDSSLLAEVDAFLDRYLLMMEVEVEHMGIYMELKNAIGKDVSESKFYSNKNLAK